LNIYDSLLHGVVMVTWLSWWCGCHGVGLVRRR